MTAGRSSTNRDRILRVGRTILARNPRASLDEIATAAELGRATLHRHFASRADLLRQIGLAALATIEATVAEARLEQYEPEAALQCLIEVLTPLGDDAHFLLYAAELFEDPDLKRADERVINLILPVLGRLRQAGLVRGDLPDAWMFASLEALLYAAWNAVHLGIVARNDAPRLVLTSFLHGAGCSGDA
jgi:AcrR family transcriptional regulator